MEFMPAFAPPSDKNSSAYWCIFKQDGILMRVAEETVRLPCLRTIADLHLQPLREHYLGTLNGTHCYTAEVDPNSADVPAGYAFQTLRSLFSLVPDAIFRLAGRAFQIMDWDRTHQFCGRCGHPTEMSIHERSMTCPQCHLVQYPRVAPAIIVAVIKDRQILLGRAARFSSNMYSVLAGFVEAGETFEDCVRREVKEEVGVDVKDIRYFGSQPWPFPHSLMVGFTARYAGGEIEVDQQEILEAGWFSADALPEIPGSYSIARRLIDWFVEHSAL